MAGPESPEETPAELPQGTRSMVENTVKAAIEQALVAEVVRSPEFAMSFSRIFNRDAPDFSRTFSRGGTHLENLKFQDLAMADDGTFAKFTERLKQLQDMGPSE